MGVRSGPMPPASPLLYARRLAKHFGPRTLFTNISLSVEPGERWARIMSTWP